MSTLPQELLELQAMVSNAGDLPPFPAVAMEAIEFSRSAQASAQELQSIIARDQSLTSKILKIVNSSMYCFQREVSTLSHAIAILGIDTIRSILTSASVGQVFQRGSAYGRDLQTRLLWQHSWGAAAAAKTISKLSGYPNCEEAYIGGLVHDIGKLTMIKNRPEIYLEILNEIYRGVTTSHEAETARFGYTHAQVGALLVKKWNFPEQLLRAILYHHDPEASAEDRMLPSIINLANYMMIYMEIGFEKNRSLEVLELPSARYLGINADGVQRIVTDVQTAMAHVPDLSAA